MYIVAIQVAVFGVYHIDLIIGFVEHEQPEVLGSYQDFSIDIDDGAYSTALQRVITFGDVDGVE